MLKKKENKGITLIALVITVIILLILAGVTIAAISGDNGILAQASRAKQESEKASIIEQIRLDIMEKQTENEGIIYDEDFYQILENYGSISNDKTTLTTTKGNYKILISDIYSGKLQKNWENKVISAIGDSITDGFGSSDGNGYLMKLSDILNLKRINNYGVASTAIGGTDDTAFVNRFLNESLSTYQEIDSETDLIFIFGGHNDFETQGNLGDTTNETLYGSLYLLYNGLKEKYPSATIVFATPLQRAEEGGNNFMRGVARIIKDYCDTNNIPVIDLYNESGITIENSSTYLMDGVHPNDEGYTLVANAIANFLLNL